MKQARQSKGIPLPCVSGGAISMTEITKARESSDSDLIQRFESVLRICLLELILVESKWFLNPPSSQFGYDYIQAVPTPRTVSMAGNVKLRKNGKG